MKKITAVEWLFKLSKERELDKFDLEQAKQIEKTQFMEILAWVSTLPDDVLYGDYYVNDIVEMFYKDKYITSENK